MMFNDSNKNNLKNHRHRRSIQRPKEKRTKRQVTNIFVYQSWWTTVLIRYVPLCEGRRGHDRMVVGITTTYVISAYHH